jgi:hypothetical protein
VPLPKPVLVKLGKLIPRLGSNHTGEVTATVEAIRRTLQNAGADLRDLCEALDVPAPEWREQVLFCRRHWESMSVKERSLIQSLEQWRGMPTVKQLAFLDNVFKRISRHAAAA